MSFMIVLGSVLVMLLAGPVLAQEPPNHLPRAAKAPPPGVRPPGLAPYATRFATAPANDAGRRYDSLVDSCRTTFLRIDPVDAARAGIHDFDATFPPTDRDTIRLVVRELTEDAARLEAIDPARLGQERRDDRSRWVARLRRELALRGTIEDWRRDPHVYVAMVSDAFASLLASDHASLEDRAWNVVARLDQVGGVLRDARRNLDRANRLAVESSIPEAAQLAQFFSIDLPKAMAAVRDPVLREEYDHHLAQAAGASAEFHHWLRFDLLPRSDSTVAAGAAPYAAWLRDVVRDATAADSLAGERLHVRGESIPDVVREYARAAPAPPAEAAEVVRRIALLRDKVHPDKPLE